MLAMEAYFSVSGVKNLRKRSIVSAFQVRKDLEPGHPSSFYDVHIARSTVLGVHGAGSFSTVPHRARPTFPFERYVRMREQGNPPIIQPTSPGIEWFDRFPVSLSFA